MIKDSIPLHPFRLLVRAVQRGAACLAALAAANAAFASTWYLDGSASGSQSGTSWADAWTDPGQLSGLVPGDTVYVSGGAAGGSATYQLPANWSRLVGGTAGHPITYQIGQDPAHSGTAVFHCATAGQTWIQAVSNVAVSGDAGDGQRHFKLTGYSRAFGAEEQSALHFSYVEATTLDCVGDFNPVSALEIDHCFFTITDLTADHATYGQFTGQTWDDSTFHDNTLYIPNSGNGTGADGLQWNGSGFSIYRNVIIGYVSAYTGGQHQDGWQCTGGASYIRIYSNQFLNIANYPVYGDAYFGGFAHLQIFNNVISLDNPGIQATNPPQGIAVGPDGAAWNVLGYWPAFTDILIANNLISDYGHHGAVLLQNNAGQSSVFTRCVVQNNVAVNSGGFGLDSAVTTGANLSVSSAQAQTDFAAYAPLSATNDFHLLPTAFSLIGQGNNLSSYFNIDQAGNPRPITGAWDIGPYNGTGEVAGAPASSTSVPASSTSVLPSAPAPSGPVPVITASLTASVSVGAFFNYGIYASNSPTSFRATGVPPGLAVDTAAGGISGHPTTPGVYSVIISATNSNGTGSAILVVAVMGAAGSGAVSSPAPSQLTNSALPAPAITAATTATGTIGQFFNYGIYASNQPTSFGAGAVPAGLTVDLVRGGISGRPTTAGVYRIPISASNSGGTGSAVLLLTIGH